MLHVKNIEKYYGSQNNVTKALDRISFDVEDGAFIAIMGASGSGKTTLLNCISTIDTVSAGSILLDGEDVTALSSKALAKFRRERLGFVFQDFNLLDTLTLEENIGLALPAEKRRVRRLRRELLLPVLGDGDKRARPALCQHEVEIPHLAAGKRVPAALEAVHLAVRVQRDFVVPLVPDKQLPVQYHEVAVNARQRREGGLPLLRACGRGEPELKVALLVLGLRRVDIELDGSAARPVRHLAGGAANDAQRHAHRLSSTVL